MKDLNTYSMGSIWNFNKIEVENVKFGLVQHAVFCSPVKSWDNCRSRISMYSPASFSCRSSYSWLWCFWCCWRLMNSYYFPNGILTFHRAITKWNDLIQSQHFIVAVGSGVQWSITFIIYGLCSASSLPSKQQPIRRGNIIFESITEDTARRSAYIVTG